MPKAKNVCAMYQKQDKRTVFQLEFYAYMRRQACQILLFRLTDQAVGIVLTAGGSKIGSFKILDLDVMVTGNCWNAAAGDGLDDLVGLVMGSYYLAIRRASA